MDLTIQHIFIILQVFLIGLSAGLCFTWANAVTTGIGQLDDFSYLNAFQQMNRSIINPLFILVFFGPFFLGLINLFLHKSASDSYIYLLLFAFFIYFFGVLLVTILGNVPLNNILDKVDFANASSENLNQLRIQFEDKWNHLHLIRTISSSIAFLLGIITLFIKE